MEVRSGLVKDHFGYWPEFADAKVVNFSWAQPGQIDLALHYVDADQGKDAIISLRFSGVSDVELSDLKSENVVDCLSAADEVLLLLYAESQMAVLTEDLFSWVEYSNASVFRRKVLQKLHNDRLVEYDKETELVHLSPTGVAKVEAELLRPAA